MKKNLPLIGSSLILFLLCLNTAFASPFAGEGTLDKINDGMPLGMPLGPGVIDAEAADVRVSGTVVDQEGRPMPGVTVSVQGTSIGTATDLDGAYLLTVPEGSVLVYSFIGFETQRIRLGAQSIINITLLEDMASLDEVVVVGYGTMQKRHLTGAVGSVKMGEVLASRPVVDFGQAMYG